MGKFMGDHHRQLMLIGHLLKQAFGQHHIASRIDTRPFLTGIQHLYRIEHLGARPHRLPEPIGHCLDPLDQSSVGQDAMVALQGSHRPLAYLHLCQPVRQPVEVLLRRCKHTLKPQSRSDAEETPEDHTTPERLHTPSSHRASPMVRSPSLKSVTCTVGVSVRSTNVCSAGLISIVDTWSAGSPRGAWLSTVRSR